MSKKVLPKFAMFGADGGDMSAAAVTSAVTTVEFIDNIGLEINWVGTTPVGTIKIQHSNDNILWIDYDFGSSISVSGDTGSHTVNINQQPFTYIRVVYTKGSGIGAIFATISGKEI